MREKEHNKDAVFYRFFTGNATDFESDELLEWLKLSKENRKNYFWAKRIWQESASGEIDTEQIDRSWERLKYRVFKPEDKKGRIRTKPKADWKIYALAASLAFILTFGLYYGIRMDSVSRYSQKMNKVVVPFGSRSHIVLPDGSKVWLNSGSELQYNVGFGKGDREVTLSGEAYFDVEKVKKSSFTFLIFQNLL